MANESLIIGNNNWAVKSGSLLGYAVGESNPRYVPRELDVVRNTTATYVDSNGIIQTAPANVARIQDGALLVEPQRTNLLLRSEEFDNAYWNKTRSSVTANATTAPDGTLTADKIINDTTASATHQISRNITGLSATSYTMSVYAKKGEYNFIRFWEDNQTGKQCYFNLDNGTVTNVNMNSVSIENFGNGWYRCIATVNLPSAGNFGFRINLTSDGTTTNYNGDGVSGVYLWGAQLEAGSNATSYIPTVASTVTRNADVISKTGISDLIGQTEGSIVCKFNFQNSNFSRYIFSLYKSGGFELEHLSLLLLSNNETLRFTFKNSTENLNNDFTLTSDGNNEFVVTYDSTETKFYINKSLVGTLSGKTPPITNSLIIGARSNSNSFFSGMIDNVQLYKNVLTELEINDI